MRCSRRQYMCSCCGRLCTNVPIVVQRYRPGGYSLVWLWCDSCMSRVRTFINSRQWDDVPARARRARSA